MMRLRATAESALQSPDNAPVSREALADCLEESEHVVTMLDTLMDISEAETGVIRLSLEPVQVAKLTQDVVDLYGDIAEDERIAIASNIPEDLFVRVDRRRMRQALANLLDNATKYTEPGGRIDLDARRDGDSVAVSIADTGMGIPAEELPRIWERLYRGDRSRSERGLGLGLSLVRAIVEAHHGRVDVRSEPGKGSIFTVRLPAAAPDAPLQRTLTQM